MFIRAIECEPKKSAKVIELPSVVSKIIEYIGNPVKMLFPFEDKEICILYDGNAELTDDNICRVLFDAKGNLDTVVYGRFAVCRCVQSNFHSLSEKEVKYYLKRFEKPECFADDGYLIRRNILSVYSIQGSCPYCNSEDISYGSSSLEDDMVRYPAHCETCHRDFEEWYELKFVGTNVGKGCFTSIDEGDSVEVEYFEGD